MGAGGIINDDVETLLATLHSPTSNFYSRLTSTQQARAQAIASKSPLSYTIADRDCLLVLISSACGY